MQSNEDSPATKEISGIEKQATPKNPKDPLRGWLGFLQAIPGLWHWGRGVYSRLTEPGRDLTRAKAEAIRVDSLVKFGEAQAKADVIRARASILNQQARSQEIENEKSELVLGLLKKTTEAQSIAEIQESLRLIELYGAEVDIEIPPEALDDDEPT